MTSIPPPGDGPPPAQPEPGPPEPLAGPPQPQAGPPQAGEPRGEHAAGPGNPAWQVWTAPVALIAWLFATVILTIVIAIVATVLGYSVDDSPPGVNIAGTFAQDLAMIGTVLAIASLASRPRPEHFGLLRPAIGKAIGGMIGVWIAFIVFSLVWKVAISLDDPQTLPDELGIDGSTLNLVLVVVIITVLAPLGEELLFRGYVFGALRNWRGLWPAAIITGLIFGAVHIGSSPIGYVVPLAFFGFGLCMLYHRTGSLYPCIALHAANNSLALGVDQKWGWEIAAVMFAAIAASLALATLLGRELRNRADRAAGPLAAPAA